MGRLKQESPEEISSHRAGPGRLCAVSGPGRLTHRDAKPLKGLGAHVLGVVSRHDSDTYRAVYTVRFKAAVYVLHAFQKKAKRGSATPKPEIDLVKRRLRAAEQHYTDTYGEEVDQ